ncbi:MAG: type II toxin-antitoxin system VapC family toxin [Acidobacteria bacterium]|nr:type II toxin-antitoxin system VapC family toxin [Acidobacteriota bacterium]
MIYVPDTNNLLRFAIRADTRHTVVLSAIRKIKSDGHKIYILPQTCVEFWNVCTRPVARNGFGLSVRQANHSLGLVERIFPLLPDNENVHREWRKLVLDFGVSGVQVHDARIAAAMLVHQVTHILTFNTADFARYAGLGIAAVDPTTI